MNIIKRGLLIQQLIYNRPNIKIKNRMKKNINNVIVDEEDFDPVIWKKAQMKNNSGYLDEEYETTKEFPLIPDYHFRVQDDLTILEFQKLALNDPNNQPLKFQSASSKFQNKLNSLLEGINKVQIQPDNNQNKLTQQHGFYSLEGEFDSDAAIKQAFGRLQLVQLQDKMKHLQLNEKKPKFIKKAKGTDKMKSQAAAPVANLSKQFNKLSIDQEDM